MGGDTCTYRCQLSSPCADCCCSCFPSRGGCSDLLCDALVFPTLPQRRPALFIERHASGVSGGRKRLLGPPRGLGAELEATRAFAAVSGRLHARANCAASRAVTNFDLLDDALAMRLSRSDDPPSSSSTTRAGFPAVGSGSLAPRGVSGQNRWRPVHPPLSAVVSQRGLFVLLPEPWRSSTSCTARWRRDTPAATTRPLHRAPRERGFRR